MTCDEFICYVENKIAPYVFLENVRASLSELFRKYTLPLLLECVDIGIKQYFRYDENGTLTRESVLRFLDKLGGIAYNKSRPPIDQEINRIKNKCNRAFSYWDDWHGESLIRRYIESLENAGWTDQQIINDLHTDFSRLINSCHNWKQWCVRVEKWIDDIDHWKDQGTSSINQEGTVIPDDLFMGLLPNVQSLCKQINCSYENNLYDCTAVIMRRLLEGLLILSYQNKGIEAEITENNGRHFTLDKMIRNAENNTTLALSANTRKDMSLFRDLGNYSAHKIWYNCTQQDIKPHILKYRVIVEELMYKSGIKR